MMTKNQCYSHEPHWELSKKEVKNVFHYEESNLEKTIMEINAILTDCVETIHSQLLINKNKILSLRRESNPAQGKKLILSSRTVSIQP